MGPKTYFPGANDNASGIAILLNLASYFSIEENRPNNNLVFIAFGAEEIGLLGSKHFINNPLIPLNKINWLYNLDIAGTGSEGLKVVHNKNAVKLLKTLININNDKKLLKNIFERNMACNSDHCYFDALGIPVLYGYTLGGSKAYHDTQDIADNLEYENMKKYHEVVARNII